MALMIFIIALIIGVNFMTIPLFLYGSFGSDALLDLSTVERVLNVLFLSWVFLVLPNLPLAGMLVSIRQMSQRYLYLHAGAFLLVVAAGIVFFMGESTLVWGTALVLVHLGGLASLVLLWRQLMQNRKNTPSDQNIPPKQVR